MKVVCCVRFCRSSSYSGKNPNVSFFSWPKDKNLTEKWIKEFFSNSFITGFSEYFKIKKSLRICSLHFEETSINGNTKRLSKNAVPTIFRLPTEPTEDSAVLDLDLSSQVLLGDSTVLDLDPSSQVSHDDSAVLDLDSSSQVLHDDSAVLDLDRSSQVLLGDSAILDLDRSAQVTEEDSLLDPNFTSVAQSPGFYNDCYQFSSNIITDLLHHSIAKVT
jgi:hypothetical protein